MTYESNESKVRRLREQAGKMKGHVDEDCGAPIDIRGDGRSA